LGWEGIDSKSAEVHPSWGFDPLPAPDYAPLKINTQLTLVHCAGRQLSPHNIDQLYKFFSAITHGGFSARLFFTDDPGLEDIEPREHPKNTRRAVIASSRLLLEICYLRDQWDNDGLGLAAYEELVAQINALR